MNETDHDGRREEIAAYLLGSLEPGEAASLEQHLEECVECRAELDWLRPAIQVLPDSIERVAPPPELRGRILEEVRADAKRSKVSGDAAQSTGTQGLWGRLGRGRPLGLRPLAGLAAVALIVAAVAGYAIRDGQSGDGGASTVVAGHAPGVTAKMVRKGDSGTLLLANLRPLPGNRVLQTWVQRGDRVESAGSLFVPDRHGLATATIEDMNGVSAVMVTTEPRGGSEQPTSAPIVNLTVPQ